MNKKAIAQTALCRYDDRENCYLVESPLCDRVLGAGDTEEEAWRVFHELLNETYIAYLEGNLVGYEKRGRPAKGNIEFHAQVKPEVKEKIAAQARKLGISQGEVIAYLSAAADMLPDLKRRYDELLRQTNQQICSDRRELSA
jgi:hypothetical protein